MADLHPGKSVRVVAAHTKGSPFRKGAFVAKLLSAPTYAERSYAAALKRLFKSMHVRYVAHLEPELKDHALIRHDGLTRVGMNLDELTEKTMGELRAATGPLFDRMAKQIKASNDRGQRLLGINYRDIGISAKIAHFRDANVRLVEKAGRDYAKQVRDVFTDPDNLGLSVDELKDELLDRGDVSESKAKFIAVDQTLKLNAAISQARHKSAGINKYEWSTSGDERVRPMHADLDGEIYSYDDPPETNDDGDTNNPGEDYGCRCVALPITSDEDADEDE